MTEMPNHRTAVGWMLLWAVALALMVGTVACSRSGAPAATVTSTPNQPQAAASPSGAPARPTTTPTVGRSPTPAPPTATFTPAPTRTSTPVPPLLERLPTESGQEFTLTLTNAELSELIELATKDAKDPEVYWPEAEIHPDEIVVKARLVATGRALVIDATITGDLVLQSGIPLFALADMETYILCYFCFAVVDGEPTLLITPSPPEAGDELGRSFDPNEYSQIGGGAHWYAMAEGMVNNALWYVDASRPARVSLGDFTITEVTQEEGLLILKGRTK